MLEKATEISKCNKSDYKRTFSHASVKPSFLKRGCKFLLKKLVMPAVWHLAMVRLPEIGEKAEWLFEKVASLFENI